MEGKDERRRPIEWWERQELESHGCYSPDWSGIRVCDATDLSRVRNVKFVGAVSLGALGGESGGCIEDACLENCVVGNYVEIRNIGMHIKECIIGDGARICNTALIEFEPESLCGLGLEVNVLDESGSRPVTIYPGLSAQTALLMARMPKWNERHFKPVIEAYLDTRQPLHKIGNNSVVINCGQIVNVIIGDEVRVEGAKSLHTGMIINNAAPGKCMAYVGNNVDAEGFIIEDGRVDSAAIIRNCYIGQGARVEKGFYAHDSLIFANTTLENGEACALFAGPYTVSMHKSSLLIGCQTSFMNAGSGTNQSNHMYKLGPVHWGLLERGVKTSSASYLMLGAKIGAFSLLMGQHKTHPDSSEFPYSYLFGDEKGATVVVPGVMLRSCGLLRDEKKWPNRDRRQKRYMPLHDRIIFDVLNPTTIDKMLTSSEVIEKLLQRPADDDHYIRYRGMKFTRASLERARNLYKLAIYKYLSLHEIEWSVKEGGGESGESVENIDVQSVAEVYEWVDIAGLPMPRPTLQRALEATTLEEIEGIFSEAYDSYYDQEKQWIDSRIPEPWRRTPEVIADYAREFDKMVEEDRAHYLEDLNAQNEMLAL